MGRGRAKAIQKRIARDLKYSTTATDLDRLRAELTGAESPVAGDEDYADPFDEEPDAVAEHG